MPTDPSRCVDCACLRFDLVRGHTCAAADDSALIHDIRIVSACPAYVEVETDVQRDRHHAIEMRGNSSATDWPCADCAYSMPFMDQFGHINEAVRTCRHIASKHANDTMSAFGWHLCGWPMYCPQQAAHVDLTQEVSHFTDHPYRI